MQNPMYTTLNDPNNPMLGLSSGMNAQPTFSYQQGGMIGPGGMPEPMGVGLAPQGQIPQGVMTPQMLEMHVNRFTQLFHFTIVVITAWPSDFSLAEPSLH